MGLYEWNYWNIKRRTDRFVPWVARKLPKKLQYYVIVAVACKTEPRYNPGDATALQMLNHLTPTD